MKKYIKYLLYVLEHKKNVFKTCWKRGLYLHAFTHDLSKFLPSEFIPYARNFYGNYQPNALLKDIGYKNIRTKESVKEDFEKAWKLHYKRNKHHPEHWNGKPIPHKHIMEMICDLEGMSLKFGDTAQAYYLNNYNKWNLEKWSRHILECNLGLLEYNAPICECSQEYWMTLGELVEDSDKYYKEHGVISCGTPEAHINDLLKPIKDKYGIENVYRAIKGDG